jgi:hypothetical protein
MNEAIEKTKEVLKKLIHYADEGLTIDKPLAIELREVLLSLIIEKQEEKSIVGFNQAKEEKAETCPACKTCGGSGEKITPDGYGVYPCPDCNPKPDHIGDVNEMVGGDTATYLKDWMEALPRLENYEFISKSSFVEALGIIESQQKEIAELKNLISIYRIMRSVDGGEGRVYDSNEHGKADRAIEKAEQALKELKNENNIREN